MKGKAYCDTCKKDVPVKKVYFAGFHCTVYLGCGHHIHFVFAGKFVKEHHDIQKESFVPCGSE